ncbi:MAG TPA: TlpA disulfide reductase family protein [Acetobacteraceae bacterium]|nr:TlpA disulfide reductase family protein [Acetobacteraceae bacterium]
MLIPRRAMLRTLSALPLAVSAQHGRAASTAETRQATALAGASFIDAAGNPHRLGELDRPLLLVNLWAAWCPGCQEELPTLRRLAASMQPGAIEIVLLSHAMNWAGDVAYLHRNPLPFRHWRLSPQTSDGTVAAAFRFEVDRFGLPQSVVFAGRERAVVLSQLGSLDWTTPGQVARVHSWLAACN